MKSQKLFHLTVHFENFNHSFGRDLLAELLCNLLGVKASGNPKQRSEALLKAHPNVVGVVFNSDAPGQANPNFRVSKLLLK